MIITPDLKQNIFYTLFFTVTHNGLALFYFCGMIFATGLSLYRPSRKSILLLIGFSLLLFGFEYNKHIVENLREQTLNSLITVQEHNQVRRVVNFITLKFLPLMLPVGGWGCVLLSLALYAHKNKLNKCGKIVMLLKKILSK